MSVHGIYDHCTFTYFYPLCQNPVKSLKTLRLADFWSRAGEKLIVCEKLRGRCRRLGTSLWMDRRHNGSNENLWATRRYIFVAEKFPVRKLESKKVQIDVISKMNSANLFRWPWHSGDKWESNSIHTQAHGIINPSSCNLTSLTTSEVIFDFEKITGFCNGSDRVVMYS